MYEATVDTLHFRWRGVGRTETEAVEMLRRGWLEHCRQYPDAEPSLMGELIDGGEVTVYPVSLSQCYRDGEPLLPVGGGE